MSSTLPSFAIIHGLAEGRLHSRHLYLAMIKTGFEPASPEKAEIIIAHSGGSYMVPTSGRAKVFIHINTAHWPGRTIAQSLQQKIAYDYRIRRQQRQLVRWFLSGCGNCMYLLNIPYGLRMRGPYYRASETLATLPDGKHVFIRNHVDSYCNPDAILQATRAAHTYITIPGSHDDCWREPEPYVAIIMAVCKSSTI